MRTTLDLDDEALRLIREHARSRGVSLGKAASELVWLGAESLPKFRTKNGWVVFDLPPGSPPLTLEAVAALEAEDE